MVKSQFSNSEMAPCLLSRHPSAMRNQWLKDRLVELRTRGKTATGLAKLLRLQPARITDMIKGERRIAGSEVPRIAAYLEMPEHEVLALLSGGAVRPAPIRQVMVRGAVQAGLFINALEWPPDDWYPCAVGANPRYDHIPQYGLEVRGPSMNRVYPHGSIVVVVKLLDLGRDPLPGERVVCVRRGPDDGFEATVKELQRDPDGVYWLWPRSDHPEFQQPWRLPRTEDADFDGEDVSLQALVIGSYRPES